MHTSGSLALYCIDMFKNHANISFFFLEICRHRKYIGYTDSTVESLLREICTLGDPLDEISVDFLFLLTA